MTSAIKPPGSGPFGGLGPPGATEGAGVPAGAFRARLEDAAAVSAPTAASGPPGGVADIVADLRAGRIDASIAVDRIVTRHIEAAAAAGLDPTMRADLEAHLRRMLADDPTLIAIQEDLARAG